MPEIQLSEFYIEFIGFTLTLIVALAMRDWATSFIKGMKFKMNKAFQEGDKVILDGCPALIVRIGMSETVFGVYGKAGYTCFKKLFEAGLSLKATGDCLCVAPPFICEKNHIDEIIEKLRNGITNYQKSL